MNRYALQWVVIGGRFYQGYGAHYYPFLWLAKIALILSMIEFGHVFEYRIMDTRSKRVVVL